MATPRHIPWKGDRLVSALILLPRSDTLSHWDGWLSRPICWKIDFWDSILGSWRHFCWDIVTFFCSAIVSQVPDEKELRDLQQDMWKCRRKAMDPRGLNFWIFCKRIKQQANAQHQLSPEEKAVHGPELVWFHSVARCCKSLIVHSRSNRLAYLCKVKMLNLVTPAAHLWGPKHWRSQPFAAVWSGLGDCHQRKVGPSGSVCLVQFICNRQVIFHWGTLAC